MVQKRGEGGAEDDLTRAPEPDEKLMTRVQEAIEGPVSGRSTAPELQQKEPPWGKGGPRPSALALGPPLLATWPSRLYLRLAHTAASVGERSPVLSLRTRRRDREGP